MLETYLDSPSWYRQHMGTTELDEVTPVVFQVLPTEKPSSIYGTNSSANINGGGGNGGGGPSTAAAMARKRSLLMMSSTGSIDSRRGPQWSPPHHHQNHHQFQHQQPDNLRPIHPHQIFSKTVNSPFKKLKKLQGKKL